MYDSSSDAPLPARSIHWQRDRHPPSHTKNLIILQSLYVVCTILLRVSYSGPIWSHLRKSMKTHNCSKTPEYTVWRGMLDRCRSTLDKNRKYYLNRGITVCERWKSFTNFIADLGPRPTPLHQLERVDNNKGYEPDNCKWVTIKENARNRSNVIKVEFEGSMVAVADLAEKFNIKKQTIRNRLSRGLNIYQALSLPIVDYSNRSFHNSTQEKVCQQ